MKRQPQPADDRPSEEALVAATGEGWDAWFGILDEWGATHRTHTETATHLREDLGVPGWWAQSISVSYQRSRGLRLKHQQADGFSVSTSRTMAVPIATVFEAFTDARRRRGGSPTAAPRCARPGVTAPPHGPRGSTGRAVRRASS